jgi:large subunit ribosomal protein L21
MYAVIRTGGKQYKVAPQDVLQIEKIEGAAGDAVSFSDVLMVAQDGEPLFGVPLVSGAVVSAEVVEQGRGPKIIIFKKKRRQNYRRKNGHRQDLTTVRILEILTDGRAPAKAASKASTAPEGASEGEPKKVKRAAKPKTEDEVQGEAQLEAPKKSRTQKED